jgi:ribosome maturation factor RimP
MRELLHPRYTNSPLTFGGWPSRAAFFVLDADHPHHIGLEARIAGIVGPTIGDMGFELVRVAVLGRDRPTVQIMADRADGAQITVEDCEAISHAVGAVLDVEDPLPGNWTLEVSSAGIDRPLTRRKDWNRFAGHLAKVEMTIPTGDGRKRFTGVALGADETAARMRLDDGSEVTLPMADIRRAKLVLTDALIEASANPPPTN